MDLRSAECSEIKKFTEHAGSDTIASMLELIKSEPRGLTVSDIAIKLKLNKNTVRKYALILTAGGCIEERLCGHTKLFTVSNRVPVTSVLDFAFEGVIILDDDLKLSYYNRFFRENLGFQKSDLASFFTRDDFKDGIKQSAKTGFTEKNLVIQTRNKSSRNFRVRFVSSNSFSGGKKTIIYMDENKTLKKAQQP